MGEKEKARAAMKQHGVPDPARLGRRGRLEMEEAREWARQIGFPVMIKATAGGGGRGMRIVRNEDELPGLLAGRRKPRRRRPSATATSTWRSTVEHPRHIEFQVLGDQHGNVVTWASASARFSGAIRS